jgi:ABC-type uncharacterized transport system ATPase component
MSEPTITENMALYDAQHRKGKPFAMGARFYETRLKQVRREIRRLERQAFWERIKARFKGGKKPC